MAAIDIQDVTKTFGDVTALQNLDLTVEDGEIFGFLGPNGAGKSTTIDILLDFIRPTAGSATVLGHDAQADSLQVRERVGVLPDGFQVYDRLTGRQHVQFAIESKSADDDPDAILERVGIADAADRKAGGYSKGMAQRLVLGMSLVGDPDLLILDEPSTGLDPNGAREMRSIIREENERGATVFFSSHILEQVDAICDRVGILRNGELVAEDSVSGLREAAGGETTLVVRVDGMTDDARDAVSSLGGVSNVAAVDGELRVNCDSTAKLDVLETLESEGIEVDDFSTEQSSLEDLFVAYTTGDDR